MVEVNLLSDEERAPSDTSFSSVASRNIPFIGGVLLLLAAAGIALGLFVYRSNLEARIEKIDLDIAGATESIDGNVLSQMNAFDHQVMNLKKILDSHREGRKLFLFLESHTLRQVIFEDLNVDVDAPTFSASGRAASYSILAKQVSHLESLPEVSNVSVSEIALSSEGGVKFSLKAHLRPKLFIK